MATIELTNSLGILGFVQNRLRRGRRFEDTAMVLYLKDKKILPCLTIGYFVWQSMFVTYSWPNFMSLVHVLLIICCSRDFRSISVRLPLLCITNALKVSGKPSKFTSMPLNVRFSEMRVISQSHPSFTNWLRMEELRQPDLKGCLCRHGITSMSKNRSPVRLPLHLPTLLGLQAVEARWEEEITPSGELWKKIKLADGQPTYVLYYLWDQILS